MNGPSQAALDDVLREMARPSPLLTRPPACRSIWGHKFQPRYSYAYPHGVVPEKGPGGQFSGASIEYVETMLRAGQEKTYHGDVCTRCGVVTNSPPPSNDPNREVE